MNSAVGCAFLVEDIIRIFLFLTFITDLHALMAQLNMCTEDLQLCILLKV